jgi:outer membrane protein assembly factor BamB
MVYLAGYNGKVYSYSISKQSESSNAQLDQDDSQPIVGGPVVDKVKVYVASSNGNLYAMDATTLAQIWKFPTGNKIWSTPAVDNGTVFVGSFDKKVYAVDEATGNKKWSFNTQGAIIATPVINNGTVYVSSFDRHIYALDEATGSVKWQYPASGQSGNTPSEWFWATPVISNGILYAPCLDGKVYAVKTQDGSLVTTFDLGAEIPSSPVVVAGKVIVATREAQIYSLDASGTPAQLLLVNLRATDKDNNPSKLIVTSPLSVANGIVYIHGLQSDRVYALDPVTKTATLSEIFTGAASSSPAITVPTTVILTTTATVTVTATK